MRHLTIYPGQAFARQHWSNSLLNTLGSNGKSPEKRAWLTMAN